MCASFAEENDEKQPLTSKEEEERRIAEMGRPILGEHTKLEVIIEESYEFKVMSGATIGANQKILNEISTRNGSPRTRICVLLKQNKNRIFQLEDYRISKNYTDLYHLVFLIRPIILTGWLFSPVCIYHSPSPQYTCMPWKILFRCPLAFEVSLGILFSSVSSQV